MSAAQPDGLTTVERFTALRAQSERNAAERERALDALEQLVACVNDKAWTPPEVQRVLWNARAVLAEHGRKAR